MVFESRVLRIFGPKSCETIRDWRKLHNEEFRNSYSSPSIIRMIKSRRMRLAGHVARMGGFCWGDQKEGDQYEDLDARIILK
jgi:hypothetical protein